MKNKIRNLYNKLSLKKYLAFAIIYIFILINDSLAQQVLWTQKAPYAEGVETLNAVSFSIDGKGYVGTGYSNRIDFWEYDPITDTWTQKADFPGLGRISAVGFSIDGKGYFGTGYYSTGNGSLSLLKDFWEYDPITDIWTKKADFGGSIRSGAVGFSIDGKGYMGTGTNLDSRFNDFWEYDPTADTWTRKADFGGSPRSSGVGFSNENKGYIGTGRDESNLLKDFWEYNPAMDIWTQKADFEGSPRSNAIGFSIEDKGYIGTGSATKLIGGETSDFWQYNPETDEWKQIVDFEGNVRDRAIGFSIENKGYVGLGYHYNGTNPIGYSDFWELSNSLSTSFSFESNNLKSIEVHPNPSTDYIFLKNTYLEVVIMNIIGTVVYNNKESFKNLISINHLENGVYLILGRDNSGIWEKGKFIILKE